MSRPLGRYRAAVRAVAACALVAAALLAGAPVGNAVDPSTPPPIGPSSASPADTSSTPAEPAPAVSVRLNGIHPLAPQADQTLTLTGSVRNSGAGDLSNPSLSLYLGTAILYRSTFDDYAADPDGAVPPGSTLVYTKRLSGNRLPAGATESFRITVPMTAFRLPSQTWQVRELAVALNGAAPSGATVSGTLRTFLPWAPSTATIHGNPLKLAWVWPLVDRPRRGAEATWYNDGLATELVSGGRLANLLSAAQAAAAQHRRAHGQRLAIHPVRVTYAVDPMLVDDAQAMTAHYVVSAGASTRPGTGATAAHAWLAALRTAVTAPGTDVLALPYADPDVVAAERGGLVTQVGAATTTGKSVLTKELPGATVLQTGWPAGGMIDQRGAQALFATGDTGLVLSDHALPVVGPPPNETPTARADLVTDGGDVAAMLTDSYLQQAVVDGASRAAERGQSLQRFFAETLMVQLEAPYDPRSLVLAPDRRWNPPLSYASRLLAGTGKVPWLSAASLEQVQAEKSGSITRAPLTYPASARRQELSSGYVAHVAELQQAANTFAAILPAGDATPKAFDVGVERALSSAYRGDRTRDGAVQHERNALAHLMNSVHITSTAGSFVTLTSHHGKVPVTIANDLDADVRVELLVQANQRLSLARDGRVTQVIPAHQQATIEVRAAAKTSGVFPLTVQLLTPTGRPYGNGVQLNVRSTVYGTITLAITGAAMAALLIAVVIRLARRARSARRSTPAPA